MDILGICDFSKSFGKMVCWLRFHEIFFPATQPTNNEYFSIIFIRFDVWEFQARIIDFNIFQLNLAASKMSGMDTQQIYFDSVKAFSTKVLITFVRSSALFFIQTFLSSLISKSKDFEFFSITERDDCVLVISAIQRSTHQHMHTLE